MTKSNDKLTGVRACTGCGKCDYCEERCVTAASVLKRPVRMERDFARDLDDTLTLIQPFEDDHYGCGGPCDTSYST